MSEDETAKFDEITRTSMLICSFSSLDKETYILDNKPFILGGEGFIEDKVARMSIEQAFGQLNLPDLFEQFSFVLNTAYYSSFKLKEDLALAPNIYTLKAKAGDTYLLMLIITPWSDINITTLYDDVFNVITDYGGTYRRSKVELGEELAFSPDKLDDEVVSAANLLLKRIYYRIFLERTVLGGIEKTRKPTNLAAVVFQDGTFHESYLCLGKQCGAQWKKKQVETSKKGEAICPKCKEPVHDAPPIFVADKVSYAFPKDLITMEEKGAPYHSPTDLIYLYLSSKLPNEVRLVINRIEPEIFSNLVPLPTKAFFEYAKDDDVMSLYSLWMLQGEKKVRIVTGIGDSKVEGEDVISGLGMRIFVRDLNEGVKKGLDRVQIVRKSILRDWHISKFIKIGGESAPESLTSWTLLHELEAEDE